MLLEDLASNEKTELEYPLFIDVFHRRQILLWALGRLKMEGFTQVDRCRGGSLEWPVGCKTVYIKKSQFDPQPQAYYSDGDQAPYISSVLMSEMGPLHELVTIAIAATIDHLNPVIWGPKSKIATRVLIHPEVIRVNQHNGLTVMFRV